MIPWFVLLLALVDPWRPAYHFAPEKNWMNDPNGLLYADGEYHLFYQYNPFGNKWGHMSWGHAVSSDLFHWRHLPVALREENGIMIFSGSAVTDGSRMVAIYTGHTKERQHQNLAFSEDRGRTWSKFSGNPVLDIGEKNFRDPKVIRYRDRWIMVVALPREHKVRFYSSTDLKAWEHLSDFGPAGATDGIWECPDLFELDGQWVLVVNLNPGGIAGGSGGQYFVGNFDGKHFRAPNTNPLWIDYGRDLYATVSFFGTPGRRVWMGWMSNWQYAEQEPTTTWKTAQSLPREVSVRDGRILQTPAREIQKLRGKLVDDIAQFRGDAYEIQAILAPGASVALRVGTGEETVIGLRDGKLYVDRSRSGNVEFHPSFAGVHAAPVGHGKPVSVRAFVDRSSIEVFGEGGSITITDRIFPSSESLGVQVRGDVRDVRVWPLADTMKQ
ncbi:MAG TPA: glycoside hydrolase family 32 protein [Bryobacteraceae bacterium]|nr:glycoside hydrolase family 32 protein [Bryobacteraceae bacterium]